MLDTTDVSELNAWASVLQALGQEGHNAATTNQEVLREITIIVKGRLESLATKAE